MDVEIFERLRMRLNHSVKEKRYEHSLRVTQTARILCKRFGADCGKADIAAISHDLCKELPHEILLEIAARDGNVITPLELSRPSLLHGRAAAIIIRDEYGVADEAILEAVRAHTFGKPNMCTLAKIIYIADKIEPGRKRAFDTPPVESPALDDLLHTVVNENIAYLEQKGEKVSALSYALREILNGTD
jgi:nicotinate-nucleotide adenylyltransferase